MIRLSHVVHQVLQRALLNERTTNEREAAKQSAICINIPPLHMYVAVWLVVSSRTMFIYPALTCPTWYTGQTVISYYVAVAHRLYDM